MKNEACKQARKNEIKKEDNRKRNNGKILESEKEQ